MLAVAFFRNLNLGHRGAPSRAQLIGAFEMTDADQVRSFQTNGTVVFDAPAPTRTAREALALLDHACGYADAVVVRRRRWLLDLAEQIADPPANSEVTLFDASVDFPHPMPWRPERGRLVVTAADRQHLVAVNDRPHTAFGTPTAERLLGLRATSRATTTMLRLADLIR